MPFDIDFPSHHTHPWYQPFKTIKTPRQSPRYLTFTYTPVQCVCIQMHVSRVFTFSLLLPLALLFSTPPHPFSMIRFHTRKHLNNHTSPTYIQQNSCIAKDLENLNFLMIHIRVFHDFIFYGFCGEEEPKLRKKSVKFGWIAYKKKFIDYYEVLNRPHTLERI